MKKKLVGIILLCIMIVGASGVCAGADYLKLGFDIMKNDFGWNAMPFSTMEKNLVFMYFTAIFRNLYNGIIGYFSKKVSFLKPTHRIKAFVFRFVTLPAKWIWQGRQRKLRIYTSKDYCL